MRKPTWRQEANRPVAINTTTHVNASRENVISACRMPPLKPPPSAASSSTTRPPSHTLIASTWIVSSTTAKKVQSPVPACPANPTVPASPTATSAAGTVQPIGAARALSTRPTKNRSTSATASSRSRTSVTCPKRVCRTSWTTRQRTASPIPAPAAYGPCNMSAAIVDTTRTIQPIHMTRPVQRAALVARAISTRNTPPPMSSASPTNTVVRAAANSAPTVVLLFAVVSLAQPLTDGAAPGPMRKEYVPWTGCESAEMTRQATRYTPGSSLGTSTSTVASLVGPWCGAPVVTRVPAQVNTRIAPNE